MEENTSDRPQSSENRSVADNIKQVTEASKQLLAAGKQMTENLSELSERVENATNLGSQIAKSPWFLVGGAIAAGLLLIVFSNKS